MNTWVMSGTLDVKGVDKEGCVFNSVGCFVVPVSPRRPPGSDPVLVLEVLRDLDLFIKNGIWGKSEGPVYCLMMHGQIAIYSSQMKGRIDSSGELCEAGLLHFLFCFVFAFFFFSKSQKCFQHSGNCFDAFWTSTFSVLTRQLDSTLFIYFYYLFFQK